MNFTVLNAHVNTANKRKSDEMQQNIKFGGNKYGYLKEIHTKHKIKRQKLQTDEPNGM